MAGFLAALEAQRLRHASADDAPPPMAPRSVPRGYRFDAVRNRFFKLALGESADAAAASPPPAAPALLAAARSGGGLVAALAHRASGALHGAADLRAACVGSWRLSTLIPRPPAAAAAAAAHALLRPALSCSHGLAVATAAADGVRFARIDDGPGPGEPLWRASASVVARRAHGPTQCLSVRGDGGGRWALADVRLGSADAPGALFVDGLQHDADSGGIVRRPAAVGLRLPSGSLWGAAWLAAGQELVCGATLRALRISVRESGALVLTASAAMPSDALVVGAMATAAAAASEGGGAAAPGPVALLGLRNGTVLLQDARVDGRAAPPTALFACPAAVIGVHAIRASTHVAVVDAAQTAAIVDARMPRRALLPLRGYGRAAHQRAPSSAVSADGDYLATLTEDGAREATVRVWETRSGRCLASARTARGALAFAERADGGAGHGQAALLTAHDDGSVSRFGFAVGGGDGAADT